MRGKLKTIDGYISMTMFKLYSFQCKLLMLWCHHNPWMEVRLKTGVDYEQGEEEDEDRASVNWGEHRGVEVDVLLL